MLNIMFLLKVIFHQFMFSITPFVCVIFSLSFCSIQTMSCKLLLNLVDCIRQRETDNQTATSRELLMRMLEVFVLKFKTIAKQQLPVLMRNNT